MRFTVTFILFSLAVLTSQAQTHADSTITIDPNKVYLAADVMPEPPGGEANFPYFVAKNLRYPKEARYDKITGKVLVSFVVERDGTILPENIAIVKSAHVLLDEEAKRVILLSSPWTPGTWHGQPVRIKKHFPVAFKLEKTIPGVK